MPGRGYVVETADSATGAWNNAPCGATNAGPLQMELTVEQPFSQSVTQQLFRVRLVP